MKKTYIAPVMEITKVRCKFLIAESLMFGGIDQVATESDGGFVKENTSFRSNYNVWDEDWNQ